MRYLLRKLVVVGALVVASSASGILFASSASAATCATGSGGSTYYCVHDGTLYFIDCMGGTCGGHVVSFY